MEQKQKENSVDAESWEAKAEKGLLIVLTIILGIGAILELFFNLAK